MTTLDRFKLAQANSDSGFATALAELESGRKTSHWIWYIFPQLASLGRSETARFYGIADLGEACGYLEDGILYERLRRATEAVRTQLKQGTTFAVLLGSETDCVKLMSCMTLFQLAAHRLDDGAASPRFAGFVAACAEVLAAGERQGFPRCAHTVRACASG